MRPRTRTQCQDGPAPAQPGGADAAAVPASSSGATEPPASKDDAVFAVPAASATRRAIPNGSVASSKASVAGSTTSSTDSGPQSSREILLVELPAEVLVKVLGYLPYNNVSGLRMVSRRFNELCASVLNSTFQTLQSQMIQRFQKIKAKMPRRESARRYHS